MTAAVEFIANKQRIQLEGSDLSADLMDKLVEVTVDDQRSLPDFVELRFRDQDFTVIEKGPFEVGAKLKVGVDQARLEWLSEVEITALELIYDPDGTWTLVRGYDSSHRLQRGRNVRTFLKSTVGDAFKKVVSGAGVTAGSVEAGPTLEELIQPNVSDWEFLQGLARDYGFELVVDQGKVGLVKPASATGTHEVILGEDLEAMRVALSAAEQVKEVQVRSWDPAQKKAVVGKGTPKTSVAAISTTAQSLAATFGNRTTTVSDMPHLTAQGALDVAAQSFAEQLASTFIDAELLIRGNAAIHSGAKITVSGAGERFSGTYLVTAARHTLSPEGYTTEVTVSGRRDATLHGLTSPGAGSAGTVLGLVPAIVTNNTDPDKVGRVKVKLPWLSEELETDWARTVQMGGAKGGGMVIPEVDDEVLVGFEHGRLECPYVIGGLYNGKDKPGTGEVDDVSGGAVSRRSFADREGNRIELIKASDGAKGVRITTGDGKFSMYFDGKSQTIKIDSGGKVEVSSKTDLSLEAQGNLTLKATGNITAEANGNFEAKATGNFTAKATGTFEASGMTAALKGQTKASVEGSVAAELKGGATTTISGAIVKIN